MRRVGADRIALRGSQGELSVRVWEHVAPARIVVLSHGYGEHIGRYEHVAAALVEGGAVVYGPDHLGHGESDGERVLVTDFERVVDDLHSVVELARERHLGLPVVLVAHSMGGMIGARYAQRHGDGLAGLVLSAPSIGVGAVLADWLAAPELPDDPIDVTVLSRDAVVGEAYAADPLVWHGGWKRPTVEAYVRFNETIDAGPGFEGLPVLYVHGEADALVPVALAQPVMQRLRGEDFTEVIVPEARHETFNEFDREQTIELVASFAERVTAR
jgi:alpha-beta hydrolase superfamily lysophospholipase